MVKPKRIKTILAGTIVATLLSTGLSTPTSTQSPKMKMTTDIPEAITTPDSVSTPLGTLSFLDGFPDNVTTQKVYDHLDFMRGVEAFLNRVPGASAEGFRIGWATQGADNNQTVLIMENLMDSKSLFLTPNTENFCNMTWLDTSKGPLVIETPPNVLRIIDDHWFKYVATSATRAGTRVRAANICCCPGYKGEVPEGYFVLRSRTYGNLMFFRGFLENGSTKAVVENTKTFYRVYSLSDAKNPPSIKFVNVSGKEFKTIHANNFHFYDEVNAIVQYEPNEEREHHPTGFPPKGWFIVDMRLNWPTEE